MNILIKATVLSKYNLTKVLKPKGGNFYISITILNDINIFFGKLSLQENGYIEFVEVSYAKWHKDSEWNGITEYLKVPKRYQEECSKIANLITEAYKDEIKKIVINGNEI